MSVDQRSDVSFSSHGMTCRGWLYRPAASGDAPAVVMSHGFSAVKEQSLAEFADGFCAAGFAVVVFDHRYLGTSDGDERGRIIASEQHEDTRAALTWLREQPGIDANRIGLWGTKPLLMIAAENDSLIPIAQVRSAFARAGEPKKLIEMPCGHFDFYPGQPHHDLAVRAAADWFRTHLG